MRILITDHFDNAFESLRSNRMRTLLTCVGITIGVASITAILALSAGVHHIVDRQVAALSGNIAIIRPSNGSANSLTPSQSFASSTLTIDDYSAIRQQEGVSGVAPLLVINGTSTSGDSRATTTVVATTPDLASISGLEIRDGQFIDTTTNQQTAALGQQLSVDLFGTDQSIGKTFTIRGERFTVIGVLKPVSDPINFNLVDFNTTAIIHLEAGRTLLGGSSLLQQINFQATDAKILSRLTHEITTQLIAAHHGEKDFTVISGEEIAQPTSQLFTSVQKIVIAVAAISLVVGGVGVMNIMLVNVSERTREIGLRKAIGASNTHIVMQFLIESILMGLAGGIVGYLLGYLSAFAISSFLPIMPSFTWWIVGVAAGLSLVVGILSGLYPAIKAARKDPIESLRYYH